MPFFVLRWHEMGFNPEGRLLVCVYELVDVDTVIPITAFEPEEE